MVIIYLLLAVAVLLLSFALVGAAWAAMAVWEKLPHWAQAVTATFGALMGIAALPLTFALALLAIPAIGIISIWQGDATGPTPVLTPVRVVNPPAEHVNLGTFVLGEDPAEQPTAEFWPGERR